MIDEDSLESLLTEEANIREVEPHIFSLYPEGENTSFYDRTGGFYDVVLCNPLYNRLVWGYSILEYESLMQNILGLGEGWVLDAGCGSLAFTAKTYLEFSKGPFLLFDQSIKLLKMAKARITKLNGSVPEEMVFLHGDVRDLPFIPGSFPRIVSLNVIHVLGPEDFRKMLLELKEVLNENGKMAFTTLVKNDRLSDGYIELLHKTGEMYPRTIADVVEVFEEVSIPVEYTLRGGMAFIYSV
jgi:SAM-dependent methyltransferase